jgi:hypothetical protein
MPAEQISTEKGTTSFLSDYPRLWYRDYIEAILAEVVDSQARRSGSMEESHIPIEVPSLHDVVG